MLIRIKLKRTNLDWVLHRLLFFERGLTYVAERKTFFRLKGVLGPILLYVDGKAYVLTKLPISPRMLACRNFRSGCVLTIPPFRANTKRYRV